MSEKLDFQTEEFDLNQPAYDSARYGTFVFDLKQAIQRRDAEIAMLRARVDRYEQQRHQLAAILGVTGLMPIDKATKPSRVRKILKSDD